MVAFIFFVGFNFTQATMHTKPLNFISNVISGVCYIWAGNVNFTIAIVMGVGQYVGARFWR